MMKPGHSLFTPVSVLAMLLHCHLTWTQVSQVRLADFEMQSSALIREPGEEISRTAYNSRIYWFPVKVPSTVLSALVAQKVYPDPYYGMNNMFIPDASDSFNRIYDLGQYSHLPDDPNPWKKPYWYRTVFTVPASDEGKHFELVFKGINYRAAVWVNGDQVADSSQMAGMFAEHALDVSAYIFPGQENALAVKIYPLDEPGLPSEEQLKALGDFYANGGITGDIGKNVTMLCSVGWDWMPPVRDRNMGIWQPVYLRATGQVTLRNPQIITSLPELPDTGTAGLTLKLTLNNHGSLPSNNRLVVKITPENFEGDAIAFTRDIQLAAGATQTLEMNPENVAELLLREVRLWWPAGYGEPNLYRMKIECYSNRQLSDEVTVTFGVRTISSRVVRTEQSLYREFFVNGKRIYLAGGAWVPDMMLNRDSARYDNELRLCLNAHVNLIRIWGGGITPPDVFFSLADRYGLLVWSDFWITGDTQGEFKGSPDWPLESDVFIRNMTSTIYRIRNHASLLVWTGGNEGHARKELYDAMRDSIIALDGTRPFIPSSSGFARLPEGWKGSWPDDQPPGVYSGGPYRWTDPYEYYVLAENRSDWAFKDETGIPSQPPYNSLAKIIPDLVWDPSVPFPMNDTWGYHDAATGNGRYDLYYEDMIRRFGEIEGMEDYSDKMQLMNAMGYQGIFEAAQQRLRNSGGILLWKLNAAFPSLMWQLYDWFLQPNAGYYFAQNACNPVHIQLNRNDSSIAVVNRTHQVPEKLSAEIRMYDISGQLLLRTDVPDIRMEGEEIFTAYNLSDALKKASGVTLVLLRLKSAGGLISRNTYWLSSGSDFRSLSQMQPASLEAKLTTGGSSGNGPQWDLQVTNDSGKPAFFVRFQLMDGNEEVLPSFWSANYITLAPGETAKVNVTLPRRTGSFPQLALKVSGWNVDSFTLSAPGPHE